MQKRLNNIDFLKIIFNLGIIYGHVLQHFLIPQFKEYEILYKYTSYAFGYMCEFLFIISGFFLLKDLNKNSCREFVIKKVKRFWPILAFSIVLSYILSRFSLAAWTDINVIPELLFLNTTIVYNLPTVTGVAWYVSALLWSSIFYYTISKLFKEKFIYVVYLITFFSYLILFNKVHLYNQPTVLNSFISFPMIRGLGGVGLGILFAYNVKPEINTKINFKSFLIGSVEIIILFLIILYLSIIKIDYAFPIGWSLFIILFYLFIRSYGIFSIILNSDKIIIPFLSKNIYAIYIMQFIVFGILNKILYKNPYYGVSQFPIFNIIISIILCFVVGIISQFIVDKIIYCLKTRPDQTRPDQTRPDQTRP